MIGHPNSFYSEKNVSLDKKEFPGAIQTPQKSVALSAQYVHLYPSI